MGFSLLGTKHETYFGKHNKTSIYATKNIVTYTRPYMGWMIISVKHIVPLLKARIKITLRHPNCHQIERVIGRF